MNTTQKRPLSEWLEMLPEPYRSQAITNTNSCDWMTLEAHTYFRNVIKESFSWAGTPHEQGFEYWHAVYQSWLSGDFLPKDEAQEKDKTAPTNREKNALPIDVRIAFNEGVELYQTISNYELGILTDAEFIKKMREIKAKFAQPVLT